MKHEWRKKEKQYYLPQEEPERISIPEFGFFTLEGKGNPNSEAFSDNIQALYGLAYAVRMSPKKGISPAGYFDYTVYPLEGVWDLSEEGKKAYQGKLDKDELVFKLMIRQPSFVDEDAASNIIDYQKVKKPHPLLEKVNFERIEEGECVQKLHLGPYDDEPASFERMEEFTVQEGLRRLTKTHREIYLTDARKTAPEKLRTVLRFQVEIS